MDKTEESTQPMGVDDFAKLLMEHVKNVSDAGDRNLHDHVKEASESHLELIATYKAALGSWRSLADDPPDIGAVVVCRYWSEGGADESGLYVYDGAFAVTQDRVDVYKRMTGATYEWMLLEQAT